jgi:transcription elongation factor Elf1
MNRRPLVRLARVICPSCNEDVVVHTEVDVDARAAVYRCPVCDDDVIEALSANVVERIEHPTGRQ